MPAMDVRFEQEQNLDVDLFHRTAECDACTYIQIYRLYTFRKCGNQMVHQFIQLRKYCNSSKYADKLNFRISNYFISPPQMNIPHLV